MMPDFDGCASGRDRLADPARPRPGGDAVRGLRLSLRRRAVQDLGVDRRGTTATSSPAPTSWSLPRAGPRRGSPPVNHPWLPGLDPDHLKRRLVGPASPSGAARPSRRLAGLPPDRWVETRRTRHGGRRRLPHRDHRRRAGSTPPGRRLSCDARFAPDRPGRPASRARRRLHGPAPAGRLESAGGHDGERPQDRSGGPPPGDGWTDRRPPWSRSTPPASGRGMSWRGRPADRGRPGQWCCPSRRRWCSRDGGGRRAGAGGGAVVAGAVVAGLLLRHLGGRPSPWSRVGLRGLPRPGRPPDRQGAGAGAARLLAHPALLPRGRPPAHSPGPAGGLAFTAGDRRVDPSSTTTATQAQRRGRYAGFLVVLLVLADALRDGPHAAAARARLRRRLCGSGPVMGIATFAVGRPSGGWPHRGPERPGVLPHPGGRPGAGGAGRAARAVGPPATVVVVVGIAGTLSLRCCAR